MLMSVCIMNDLDKTKNVNRWRKLVCLALCAVVSTGDQRALARVCAVLSLFVAVSLDRSCMLIVSRHSWK
jgi:hypothetical protein